MSVSQDARQRRVMFARMKNPAIALGNALTFIAQREPFFSAPAGPLVGTVGGAIKRDHYLFAVLDGVICGCGVWGLTSEDVARRWVSGRYEPIFEEMVGGDTVALFGGAATNASAAKGFLRHLAGLYPGYRYATFRRNRVLFGRFPNRLRRGS
jgi:hypothetical protein